MISTTFTSPFDAPPAGGLVAVELDPRRQVAHRAHYAARVVVR